MRTLLAEIALVILILLLVIILMNKW